MEALIAKFGPRLPGILTRAALGDPLAIAEIIAVIGIAGFCLIKKKK